MSIDEVFKVRTDRRIGNLAQLAAVVAEVGALIEEVETLSISKDYTLREVTIMFEREADRDQLLARMSQIPGNDVLERVDRVFQLHEGGKIGSRSTVTVDKPSVLRNIYTPGVERVCRAIIDDPALARRYTSIGNTIAIVSNGSHVHGLGDIGPRAAMPVLEGKAALCSQLVGLSAVPILVDSKDVDELVRTVISIAPTFGGIHIEDIAEPACFELERRLDDALAVPVMHDSHATAVAVLAGVLSACARAGIDLHALAVAQIGLGAAGLGIAELLLAYGVQALVAADPDPASLARLRAARAVSLDEAMATADIVVATTDIPGLIPAALVRPGQMIIAMSSRGPEIEPDDALAAGARFGIDSTQINNLLAFPGLFKGAVEAGAERIDIPMKLAAAAAIAARATTVELLPDPLDRKLHRAVADAVAAAARR